jgi:hypothetical protein
MSTGSEPNRLLPVKQTSRDTKLKHRQPTIFPVTANPAGCMLAVCGQDSLDRRMLQFQSAQQLPHSRPQSWGRVRYKILEPNNRRDLSLPTCFFATDLHGKTDRYNKLLASIIRHLPAAVFLGGDLLPRSALSAIQFGQEDFVHDCPAVSTLAQGDDGVHFRRAACWEIASQRGHC